LTSHWRWRVIAVCLFALSLVGYRWAATAGLQDPTAGLQDPTAGLQDHLAAGAALVVPPAVSGAPFEVLASVVALVALLIGIVRPSWGVRTLLVPAGLVIFGLVA